MEAFAESSVRMLFEKGKIKNIKDLYHLTAKDFEGVDGFGERKIANALNQIQATKEMTIGEFVDRLGIDLVGIKAMKKLGITTSDQLFSFSDDNYVIGQNLIAYVKENKQFITDLLSVVKIKGEVKMAEGSKKVCMTGTGPKKRNDLIKDIEAKGDMFVDTVGKDTNILLCEDPSANTTKLQKARKLGVQVISYSEYFG